MTNAETGDTGQSLEHATVVEIDGRGVLIRGASGSGKTALAIELLFRCRICGISSALIADDYAFLTPEEGSAGLVATAPEKTAGQIEFRGFGIVNVAPDRHRPQTRLALSALLCPQEETERVADPDRFFSSNGIDLPELALPMRQHAVSACAILGWLGLSDRIL